MVIGEQGQPVFVAEFRRKLGFRPDGTRDSRGDHDTPETLHTGHAVWTNNRARAAKRRHHCGR